MDLSGYVVRQEQVITDSSGSSGLMQIQARRRGAGQRRRNRGGGVRRSGVFGPAK